MKLCVLALAGLLSCATLAQAQLYRWVDEKGKVHFGDTPPPASKGVQKSGAPKSEARPEAKAGSNYGVPSNEPYALQVARSQNPVSLYTAPDCGAGCDEARSYLNKRGVPFAEISITDSARLEELKNVSGGNGVPVMLVGKSVHKGFETGLYETALDSAGYPKAGVLPPRAQTAPTPSAPPAEKAAEAPKEEPTRPVGPYAPGAPPQKRK